MASITARLDAGPDRPMDAALRTRLEVALTEAARAVLGAPEARVALEAPEDASPAALVRRFLSLMEAREIPAAQALLAPGCTMTFPGGIASDSLEGIIAWARPRYRFVRKSFDRVETVPGTPAVVWCSGTLHGEWPDGTPFAGIRFLDRFEVSDGRITRQEVWNDLAEFIAAGGSA
jgi:hypothetical protein